MRKAHLMKINIGKIAQAAGVDLSQVGAYIKVESGVFMPLCIERIGPHTISVAHYFEDECGDLVADPDVVFLIGPDGEWYPVEWTMPQINETWGGFRRYVEVDTQGNWTKANLYGQADLASFCHTWAKNIKHQGFIEAVRP